MEKIWLKNYPEAVPHEINLNEYSSIIDIFEKSCHKFRDRASFTCMGSELTFEDLNFLSADFAAFLQHKGLKKGDRIAIQLANVLQYPVVLFGAIRAGLIVVNTNPLYTAREMKHQFIDSGCKAIVILENSCAHLQEIIKDTEIELVVTTGIGDLLGWPKSLAVNSIIKYVKKMVPAYSLPDAITFYEAMEIGRDNEFTPVELKSHDLAFLQYTGGTTGVAKGAMLSHKNIVANVLQIRSWMLPKLKEGEEVSINALPLYHIFSLTVNCLAIMTFGGTNLMVTNPRDIPGFIKLLKKTHFTVFPGLNTLFNALMNAPDFKEINFKNLKVSVAGGMALQKAVALKWMDMTKTVIVEGYGLTETSPVACCNPIDGTDKVGTIGLPLPSTEIKLVDDDGKEITKIGESGELCVRGPQVMEGYWQRPEETAKVMLDKGWLKTGDVAIMDEDGYFKIVDRKKDMILVSGFNVYPNEVEEVVMHNAKVLEVAAVGIPDEKSGEVVKIFVVKKDSSLTEQELIDFCKDNLAGYKRPKEVEFRKELPKTNVGKILRRALRDETKN